MLSVTSAARRLTGVVVGLLSLVVVVGAASASHDEVAQSPVVHEFQLTAAPLRWEIEPGLVVDGWGYNGQVPGPELHVREGDLVRVRLRNLLPVPTTIHWHGLDVPLAMDGIPGFSQPEVMPEEEFTYEFTATNPGTRWYHTHVSENIQQELGLYGAFIVEPKDPEPLAYDADVTYVLDERALDITPQVALGQAQVRGHDSGNGRGGLFAYDLFLMNGTAADAIEPMRVSVGQRIRLRLVNAGNLVHSMHLNGQAFTIVATDGNLVPPAARLLKDTVLIGPGERYDLEVLATYDGVLTLGSYTLLGHDPTPLDTQAMARSTPTPAASSRAAVTVKMLNDRFDSPKVSVPVGATVRWTNTSVNLHTVTSFDGSFDGGAVVPGDSTSLEFHRPGLYRYYCRQHLLGGMLGTIVVE